jgi:intracellular sulfur oxidation DsrE/DsrF family protein
MQMRGPVRFTLVATALLTGTVASFPQTAETPYGTARFEPYQDIEQIKQLKVVWDFNFTDPRAVDTVFNYLNALLNATDEFGPHEIEPIKVVVVSHGPELVVFARRNFAKYADIVERAAALAKRGVRFEICRNAATFLGFTAQDFHGFAALVPPAPFALAYWQSKGYTLNAVGATMPITPLSEHNKLDTNR